jgi:hypothetical protein
MAKLVAAAKARRVVEMRDQRQRHHGPNAGHRHQALAGDHVHIVVELLDLRGHIVVALQHLCAFESPDGKGMAGILFTLRQPDFCSHAVKQAMAEIAL